jgi:hypothetical protein
MTKQEFFIVCDGCGAIEWIETIKLLNSRGQTEERINELTREGEMKYPWKMDICIYTRFSETKIGDKKFYERKQQVADKYDDLFCVNCEKRLIPIPFSDINKELRKQISAMSSFDRILFAQNYKMAKVIEKN